MSDEKSDGEGGGTNLFYLVRDGAVTEVPTYPGTHTEGGITFGGPFRLSGSGGRMVGTPQLSPDPASREVVVWDDLAPRRLVEILDEHGVDTSSFPSAPTVSDLSADGRVIVGMAVVDGATRVWRATLPATARWADGSNGFFDDADRWAPAAVPDSLTAVTLDATSSGHTISLRRDEAAGSLVVNSQDTPFVTLDLGTHTLTLGPSVSALVVGDTEDGALQLDGGRLEVDGNASLGRSGDARGVLTLLGGHALSIDSRLTVGEEGTDADGSGILVLDGTLTTSGGMILGDGDGTSGLISLFPGTSLQNTAEAATSIGFRGDGLLTADAAFVSHTGPLFLGAFETGTGRIELENASSMLTTDSLWIGLRGAGELLVASGSGLSTGPVVMGDRAGSVASVRLTGAGSRWDVVGDLVVGDEGSAVLEIVDQAFICLGGVSRIGPQGYVITDGTVRVVFMTDCAAIAREARQATPSGLRVAALTVDAGGEVEAEAIEVGAGGVVDGAGVLAVPLTNGGTLAPGGDGALGTLALTAPLTQTADGTLTIEVGGSAADGLTVEGDATLGGTLRVAALPGETPTVGQSYDVLTAISITGAFDAIEAPEGLTVSVSATTVTVTVAGEVAGEPGLRPDVVRLDAPAPNPASASVALRYAVPEAGAVRMAVYDALGREVAVLADGPVAAGIYTARFDASRLAPGVYVVRLGAGAEAAVQTLTIVR